MSTARRLVLGLFATSIVLATPVVAKRAADPARRVTMAQLYGALQVLLPLSVDAMAFQAPENQKRVREALASLSADAEVLRSHGSAKTDAETFDQLGRSLARDAREAHRRYSWGQQESAAHLVQEMTTYCVSCHSRLPAEGSPLAAGFVGSDALGRLQPHEQATIALATRRFDEALDAYEAAFVSSDVSARQLLEPISDYLVVALRVKQDPARAIRAMETLETRADVWGQLRNDIGAWRTFLRKTGRRAKAKTATVKEAERLIELGERLGVHPGGRQGLVHWITSSALLYRVVDRRDVGKAKRARAEYLIGLCESRIRQSYWASSAELHLERAIRLAPHSVTAREAYTLLEEEIVVGAVGPDGRLPAPVVDWLAELAALARPRT
jgi:tetratricopeptide (TPR) repeat protein